MRPIHIILTAIVVIAELAVLVRAITRPHREPASRLAWVIIIIVAPVIGTLAYLLLGETRVRRCRFGERVDKGLPRPEPDQAVIRQLEQSKHCAPFALARTINRVGPTGGNRATLAADSDSAIDAMVADIDGAEREVHLTTYIWLADSNGLKMKDALIRAARRGVAVRVLADAMGSRRFIRSKHWRELLASGADVRRALPFGNVLRVLLRGRIDLRNHRKSMIVDNRTAWVGSQNLADPEFRLKPRFAPWVDIMTRWEGPVVLDCQFLFVSDWMGEGGSDISACLAENRPEPQGSIIAQAIGTGPIFAYDAMPTCFSELIHSARRELVVTTPYFVPDEQLLYAFLSAARRGVRVTIVLPKRNDSRFVAGASRSYYGDLVKAGARIFEFRPGLLHAKTMVVDRQVALVGSANLDRRSFELNFENNLLVSDAAFAGDIRKRQDEFIAQSNEIMSADLARLGLGTRLWRNTLAMLSPLL
ncbi:MAG TPA: cardiolipin synthase [Sphingomicrobium sp.]|jgi:cardiolipin synthase|nr:cardiolipin synthase [Sphingomicrobium sp.]